MFYISCIYKMYSTANYPRTKGGHSSKRHHRSSRGQAHHRSPSASPGRHSHTSGRKKEDTRSKQNLRQRSSSWSSGRSSSASRDRGPSKAKSPHNRQNNSRWDPPPSPPVSLICLCPVLLWLCSVCHAERETVRTALTPTAGLAAALAATRPFAKGEEIHPASWRRAGSPGNMAVHKHLLMFLRSPFGHTFIVNLCGPSSSRTSEQCRLPWETFILSVSDRFEFYAQPFLCLELTALKYDTLHRTLHSALKTSCVILQLCTHDGAKVVLL